MYRLAYRIRLRSCDLKYSVVLSDGIECRIVAGGYSRISVNFVL